jgi:hypothetical protein
MHISLEFLKPTDCSFYGIVPGSANYPLGRIALNVCFGIRQNYRREKLDFEVMDWPSQYHTILGRPVFSRFMAVPHYTYLVLKMPGPKGIIIVKAKSQLCREGGKHDYGMRQATRRTCCGARDEETICRSIRRRQSYRRRREGHDGISIKNNKVELKNKTAKATSHPRAMPSRSRTEVIGRISWVTPCILHYKYNKVKTFLIFKFTSLSKGKCGKRTNHTKRSDNKFQTYSREIRNSRVSHIHEYHNIGLSESSTHKGYK